jgi:hypothetical protein
MEVGDRGMMEDKESTLTCFRRSGYCQPEILDTDNQDRVEQQVPPNF